MGGGGTGRGRATIVDEKNGLKGWEIQTTLNSDDTPIYSIAQL